MRKIKAKIATYLIVGVLSIFGMSHFAYASVVYDLSYPQTLRNQGSSRAIWNATTSSALTGIGYLNYCIHVIGSGSFPNSPSIWSPASVNPVTLRLTSPTVPLNAGRLCVATTTSIFNGGLSVNTAYMIIFGLNGGTTDYVWSAGDYFVLTTDGNISGTSADSATRFIGFTPPVDGYVQATTSSKFVSSEFYIDSSVWNSSYRYILLLTGLSQTGKSSIIFETPHGADALSTISGDNTVGTTTSLLVPGHYLWQGYICKLNGIWIFKTCDDIVVSSSTDFWVGATTTPWDTGINAFSSNISSLLASSTYNLGQSCNLLSDFNMGNCITDIFYPGSSVFSDDLLLIENMPPWGYIYRVYSLFTNTSASTSIPILDAVVPNGIPGSGSHLTLDLNHSLDYILNATSSIYNSGNATSSQTFYEITSFYWNIFVYLGLFVYLLGRIIGLRFKFK